MPNRHKRLVLPLLCLLVWPALGGCDEECDSGTTECVGSGLLRVCTAGEDGTHWQVLSCGGGEACVPGDQADAGGDGKAACVGNCEVGQAECVGDQLARVCTAGGVWQLDACELGESCADGACRVAADASAVQRCVPGASQCASALVQKVCDADGTAWVQQQCPQNQVCEDGGCVEDPDGSCDDGNQCLDNKHAIRCLGEARGFEVVECEGASYCQGGRCRGAVCEVGAVCNGVDPVSGNAQVRRCVEGARYEDSECATGEVCRQLQDDASCEPAACVVGTTVCGDPDDDSVDPDSGFATCVVGAFSGVPEWVRGVCVGDTTCQPGVGLGGHPCRAECTTGAQRCAATIGSAEGIQTCEAGKWGPVEPCNPGVEKAKVCLSRASDDPAALPQRVCGEPVCESLQRATCQDGQIRHCGPEGMLMPAEDCAVGSCRSVGGVYQDGRRAGECVAGPECEDGETRCVSGASTRFRTCVDGQWSLDYQACDDGGQCQNYTDDDGLRRTVCGDDCVPNARRCDPDDDTGKGVQTCTGAGRWSAAETCPAGVCSSVGSRDALCVLACVPGSQSCTGSVVTASDGVHSGRAEVVVCRKDGTFADPTDCPGTTTCRTGGDGDVLGCVECIGPDVPGGNTEGVADSSCSSSQAVRNCAADNTWADPEPCPGGTSCSGASAPTCDGCLHSELGTPLDVCTNQAGLDTPMCAPCPAAGGNACTAANIDATQSGSADCSFIGDAAAGSNYAGEADCCASAQLTWGDVRGGSYCGSGSWGGEADCCNYAQGGGGGGSPVAECR